MEKMDVNIVQDAIKEILKILLKEQKKYM